MRCHCLDSLSDMCKCGSNLNLILQSPPNTHCEYDVCYYVFDRCLWIELKKNWHCLFKQAVNACHIYICWNSANCIQDVILFIFIFLCISSVFYTFCYLKINPYCDQTWLKKHCTSNSVSLFCIPDDTLRELTWLVAINWGHLYYKIEYLAVNAYLYSHCSTQSYNTNKNTNSNR